MCLSTLSEIAISKLFPKISKNSGVPTAFDLDDDGDCLVPLGGSFHANVLPLADGGARCAANLNLSVHNDVSKLKEEAKRVAVPI